MNVNQKSHLSKQRIGEIFFDRVVFRAFHHQKGNCLSKKIRCRIIKVLRVLKCKKRIAIKHHAYKV